MDKLNPQQLTAHAIHIFTGYNYLSFERNFIYDHTDIKHVFNHFVSYILNKVLEGNFI
jgi:hypothetical protein